jgi:hypothetical protein
VGDLERALDQDPDALQQAPDAAAGLFAIRWPKKGEQTSLKGLRGQKSKQLRGGRQVGSAQTRHLAASLGTDSSAIVNLVASVKLEVGSPVGPMWTDDSRTWLWTLSRREGHRGRGYFRRQSPLGPAESGVGRREVVAKEGTKRRDETSKRGLEPLCVSNVTVCFNWSGREDLNLRPPEPHFLVL